MARFLLRHDLHNHELYWEVEFGRMSFLESPLSRAMIPERVRKYGLEMTRCLLLSGESANWPGNIGYRALRPSYDSFADYAGLRTLLEHGLDVRSHSLVYGFDFPDVVDRNKDDRNYFNFGLPKRWTL
ncbi:hypothetical protein BV898_07116 [Hypsibius exemplaris]|uniref:Uncharacterized protein n=1 Tax=Hypsibius exemplaris TaxID=2072580 RepID=A0A1W0WUI8_HYPEX|nr:hypothetical protein BV898_07116 [Hypsibius exemplaris]